MDFNYHTHTKRCRHAQGEDREYVEQAIQSGLKILGFSDHAPYRFQDPDYCSGHRMRTEQLQEYAESVRALQKEYANDIRILLGFELEYYPDLHAQEMAFLKTENPDYVIMGQHFLGNELDQPYSGVLKEDPFLTHYVSQVLEGLATGDFLYLAHPDLAGYNFSAKHVDTEYRRLCEGAKKLGIPLEINLLGVRTHRHYPDERLFKIAAEVGNEVILGCDAHDPSTVNDAASEKVALAMIEKLGLKQITKPIVQ